MRIKASQGGNYWGNRVKNLTGEGNERRVRRARLRMHSKREGIEERAEGYTASLTPEDRPPGRKSTWEAGIKDQNQERRVKKDRGARMEQRAKGRRSLGNRRSEIHEKPAKGRASVLGRQAKPGERRTAQPLAPQSALCTAVPTDLQRARTGLQPGAAGWRAGVDEEDDEKEAASCLARGKEEQREGSWVSGDKGDGEDSEGLAYLSPGSASSTACRTEELLVLLQEDGPTRVSTIPPRAPSHRHRSNRNHRSRRASSSPPLGYWPSEAREHAQSPQSWGSPGRSALPAINRSLPRSPAPCLISPPPPACSLPSQTLGPAPYKPRAPPLPLLLSPSAAALALEPIEIFKKFVGPVQLLLPSSRENGGLRQ